MTLAAWPDTINRRVMDGSYREDPEDAIDSFEVDHGPSLDNSATSVPTTLIAYEMSVTPDEWDFLQAFYRTTLRRVLPFTMPHPRTAVPAQVFRFTGAPRVLNARYEKLRISISLRHFP